MLQTAQESAEPDAQQTLFILEHHAAQALKQ
jgi:hypothetical protein